MSDRRPLLSEVVEQITGGEVPDERLVEFAMQSAVLSARRVVTDGEDPNGDVLTYLDHAYWQLAAAAGGPPAAVNPQYLLGRVASLVELVESAVSRLSQEEEENALGGGSDVGGTTGIRFLCALQEKRQRATDLAVLIEGRDDSADQGYSAACKRLKALTVAGFVRREPHGREVYYSLTSKGLRTLQSRPDGPAGPSEEIARFASKRWPLPRRRLVA